MQGERGLLLVSFRGKWLVFLEIIYYYRQKNWFEINIEYYKIYLSASEYADTNQRGINGEHLKIQKINCLTNL